MYYMDIVHANERLKFFNAMCFFAFYVTNGLLPSSMSKLFRILPY